MANVPEPSDDLMLDALLREAGWVLGLARRLARGQAETEDLSQSALALAVERRPRVEEGLRPWLAAVVGKLARTRARGEVRRRGREADDQPSVFALAVEGGAGDVEVRGIWLEGALLTVDGIAAVGDGVRVEPRLQGLRLPVDLGSWQLRVVDKGGTAVSLGEVELLEVGERLLVCKGAARWLVRGEGAQRVAIEERGFEPFEGEVGDGETVVLLRAVRTVLEVEPGVELPAGLRLFAVLREPGVTLEENLEALGEAWAAAGQEAREPPGVFEVKARRRIEV